MNKKILIIIIVIITIGGICFYFYKTDPDAEVLTASITKKSGISYTEYMSLETKTVEVDSITLSYNSDYVNDLNDKYSKLTNEALEYNQYITTEDYNECIVNEDFDCNDKYLGIMGGLDIEYNEYEDVASIIGTFYHAFPSSGKIVTKYVDNININTGEKYENSDLLTLFETDAQKCFFKIKDYLLLNESEYIKETADSYIVYTNDVKIELGDITDGLIFLRDNNLYISLEDVTGLGPVDYLIS